FRLVDVLHGFAHVHQVRAEVEEDGRLQLAAVGHAPGLFRLPQFLQLPGRHLHRAGDGHQGVGHQVHHFAGNDVQDAEVAAVGGDEDDFLAPVVDEAAADVHPQGDQRLDLQGDGAG